MSYRTIKFSIAIASHNHLRVGYLETISAAGGSPEDISQGLPRALTKSNKPPIS